MTRLIQFANNATSRLAANLSAVGLTITLVPGDGAKFPALSGSQVFFGTLVRADGTKEVVKVTARSTDTLTIVRAVEAVGGVQTAFSFTAGDKFELRMTAGSLASELDRLDAAAFLNAITKTANYTITEADVCSLIKTDTTAGNVTITLPQISTLTGSFEVQICKTTGDTNTVAVTRSGTDTINGATIYSLSAQYQCVWLVADLVANVWTAVTSASASNRVTNSFVGSGTAGPFTLSGDPGSKNNTDVFVGGVYQQKSTYTVSGTSLMLGGTVGAGVFIECVWVQPLAIGTPSDGTVTDAKVAINAAIKATKLEYTPAGVGAVPSTLQDKLRNIFGGAIRNNSGTWSMIADSGHDPIGISSVSEPDAFTYKINYTTPGSKVGTVLGITDYELAPYGPHTGANGATDSATFCTWAPCVLYVNGRSSVSASPLWTSQTGPITTPDATSVQITHANRALAVDPPIVTPITPAAGSTTRQYHVSWGATTTTITSLDDIQGYAYYDGAAWQLASCPNLGVSIAYASGALTITHPNVIGHYNIQLTSLNSNLRPEIASITDTTTVVQFRDTAGALVGPAATTSMKVVFRRSALVPSAMDAGVRFAVDLGLCKVANADVGNVSLNNFWIIGMNNP